MSALGCLTVPRHDRYHLRAMPWRLVLLLLLTTIPPGSAAAQTPSPLRDGRYTVDRVVDGDTL